MNLREAAQQALEILEEIHPGNMTPLAEGAWSTAITALRAALAETAMQRLTDEQQEIENDSFDKQPASGIHLGVSDGADRDVEAMTDVQQEIEKTHTSVDNEYTPVKPVAWRTKNATPPGGYVVFQQYPSAVANLGGEIEPLYTAPPKRKPLTAPQIHELDWPDGVAFEDILEFTRALERAHGIGGDE
mgnify:CR=1 FL=1